MSRLQGGVHRAPLLSSCSGMIRAELRSMRMLPQWPLTMLPPCSPPLQPPALVSAWLCAPGSASDRWRGGARQRWARDAGAPDPCRCMLPVLPSEKISTTML